MREVATPQVYLISRPEINSAGMFNYLKEIGGDAWYNRVGAQTVLSEIPAAEGLIEFMGRLCYRSWEPGLNKNITKIREDRNDYLLNILRSAHGSVLEHAWFSFAIHDGSRVFTAEMNRHRVGVAISEQSLRYVRLDDIPMWFPQATLREESIEAMRAHIRTTEEVINSIYYFEGINEASDFATKKTITSAVRAGSRGLLESNTAWRSDSARSAAGTGTRSPPSLELSVTSGGGRSNAAASRRSSAKAAGVTAPCL